MKSALEPSPFERLSKGRNHVTGKDIRRLVREHCAIEGGQKAFAELHGLSEALVSQVVNGKKKPGPSIARAVGYGKITAFTPLQKNEQGA